MSRRTQNQNKQTTQPFDIRVEWQTGPRTPAWDRLWRAILNDLDPDPEHAANGKRSREGDDG